MKFILLAIFTLGMPCACCSNKNDLPLVIHGSSFRHVSNSNNKGKTKHHIQSKYTITKIEVRKHTPSIVAEDSRLFMTSAEGKVIIFKFDCWNFIPQTVGAKLGSDVYVAFDGNTVIKIDFNHYSFVSRNTTPNVDK